MADVHVRIKGDSSDLTKELDKVESALGDVQSEARNTGRSLDDAAGGFDAAEQRAMGFRDGLTGVEDSMKGTSMIAKGDLFGGLLTLGMGIGDLASSMSNLVIPALKRFNKEMLTSAKTAIATAAQHVAAAARQVAAWALMAARSTLAALKIAAAWLISIGPIAIVIAAVIGLVVVIVKNWDKISEVISKGWEWVKEKTVAVWDGIKKLVKRAADFIVDLFVAWSVVGLIIKHWDSIKDGAEAAWRGVRNAFNKVVDFMASIPRRILLAIGSVGKTLLSKGRAIITGLLDGIKEAAQNVWDWMTDIPGKLLDLLGDAGEWLYSVGEAIVQGMKDGIEAAWDALTSWLSDKASGLVDFVKNPLGIFSPSRVFKRVGDQIMEGLALGLKDGLDKAVVPMMERVAGEVMKRGKKMPLELRQALVSENDEKSARLAVKEATQEIARAEREGNRAIAAARRRGEAAMEAAKTEEEREQARREMEREIKQAEREKKQNIIDAKADKIGAEQALRQVQRDIERSREDLAIARAEAAGDSVGAAELEVKQAEADLAFLQEIGAGKAQINAAKTAIVQARARLQEEKRRLAEESAIDPDTGLPASLSDPFDLGGFDTGGIGSGAVQAAQGPVLVMVNVEGSVMTEMEITEAIRRSLIEVQRRNGSGSIGFA